MASIVKRKKSRFWTACYTNHDGRQLKKSTKTTNKNQALEIAIRYERVTVAKVLGNVRLA